MEMTNSEILFSQQPNLATKLHSPFSLYQASGINMDFDSNSSLSALLLVLAHSVTLWEIMCWNHFSVHGNIHHYLFLTIKSPITLDILTCLSFSNPYLTPNMVTCVNLNMLLVLQGKSLSAVLSRDLHYLLHACLVTPSLSSLAKGKVTS